MRGSAMAAVQYGLESLLGALRQDSRLMDSVHLSLFTFSQSAAEVFPLTPAPQAVIADMPPPRSGPSHLGAALATIYAQMKADRQPEDHPPVLLAFGDGAVGDLLAFRHQAERLKALPCSEIVYCNAGALAYGSPIRLLTDRILQLDTADASSFLPFFRVVAPPAPAPAPAPAPELERVNTEEMRDDDMPGGSLPPPPPEIHIVL